MGSINAQTLDAGRDIIIQQYLGGPDTPDPATLVGKALQLLEARVYDAAIDLLNSVIKSYPSEANAYYYLALALVKGRNPTELTYREAEKICNYLQNACTLSKHQHSHYYYLWALVKQDFYHSNGFRIDPPDVDELMALAKKAKFDRDKIAQLLRHLSPRHSFVLDAVRNRL